ncbi:MAG: LacI family DNA-binding transcriptional regulator [Bacteroidales bacterium]|jgi:LacI family transcriptional regulator
MIGKKISLSDIAKSLGVSKTLVSMVLNNHADEKGISKVTQKRVWEKIKEYNYKPNMMARGLRLGRSNTIGLIVSDISNPFYSKIARYIENFVEPKGYNIMICSTDEDVEKEIRLIKMLRDRQTDGLIISTSQKSSKEIRILLDEKYPFVLIDRVMPDVKTNSVIVDNFKGSHHAVTHMLQQGYKKIAAFAVSPSYVSTINDRIEGYLRAIKDFGLTYGKAYLKEIPFTNVKETVRKELSALLNSKDKVNALFAVNNNIAVACLECLNDMKVRIPEDIAFVCFDDLDVFKFGRPSITAISQPIEEICKNAADILLENIKNKDDRVELSQVKLPTTLIVRRSTVN